MPDTPTSIQQASAAAAAIRALDDLDAAQLADNPAEAYALLDHLVAVVSPLMRISAALGGLLDDWADQRGLPRPAGQPVCALHIAADYLQAGAGAHAARLYGVLDAAQHVLDPGTY